MNERIRELLADAKLFCYNDGTVALLGETYAGQPEIERFAELIVRECAEAVKNSIWHLPRGYKAEDQAEFVKKHFGVEE